MIKETLVDRLDLTNEADKPYIINQFFEDYPNALQVAKEEASYVTAAQAVDDMFPRKFGIRSIPKPNQEFDQFVEDFTRSMDYVGVGYSYLDGPIVHTKYSTGYLNKAKKLNNNFVAFAGFLAGTMFIANLEKLALIAAIGIPFFGVNHLQDRSNLNGDIKELMEYAKRSEKFVQEVYNQYIK
jgi:hypothetical protein